MRPSLILGIDPRHLQEGLTPVGPPGGSASLVFGAWVEHKALISDFIVFTAKQRPNTF